MFLLISTLVSITTNEERRPLAEFTFAARLDTPRLDVPGENANNRSTNPIRNAWQAEEG